MIVEMEMGGIFKWVVCDDFVFVDPIYLSEYKASILQDNAINLSK